VILRYPIKWHAGYTLFGCVAGFGICMVIFGLSTNIYLSCFILALSGVFDNVSVVIRRTILQVYTPNDMRGRVSAVESIFISSSNEIGEFESGITASAFGLRRSIVLGGVLSVAVVGVTAWLSPKLRNYQKLGSSN
jgi:sugar phosphate permease